MQAVILVGGEGTRLRPLTSTVPKPVVPLVDRPFISYMLEWLRAHGIDDVIMSCGFLATSVRNVLGDGSAYGIRLRFVEEPDPRGTAGALKFAESLLDERFLMLNGDVLTDIDLTEQIAQHERTGAKATLALVPVEDPSAYGLVRLKDDRAVKEFVEKPSSDRIDTNLISAGAYVLEREILELVPPGRNVSIEREVWPRLVGEGLYGYPIGQLLARHRHARTLPAGHLRHPRGQRQHRGARAPRRQLHVGIRGRARERTRDPAGCDRGGRHGRGGRARRQPRRARPRREDRCGQRPSSAR